MNWLRRLFTRTLPAPEPRCIVTGWGYRTGKPWRIVR